jgi:hypothetical protein
VEYSVTCRISSDSRRVNTDHGLDNQVVRASPTGLAPFCILVFYQYIFSSISSPASIRHFYLSRLDRLRLALPVPSSICPRSNLSSWSTHFRNRCGGINLWIQNSSDMFVIFVICKEGLPVIQCLPISLLRGREWTS